MAGPRGAGEAYSLQGPGLLIPDSRTQTDGRTDLLALRWSPRLPRAPGLCHEGDHRPQARGGGGPGGAPTPAHEHLFTGMKTHTVHQHAPMPICRHTRAQTRRPTGRPGGRPSHPPQARPARQPWPRPGSGAGAACSRRPNQESRSYGWACHSHLSPPMPEMPLPPPPPRINRTLLQSPGQLPAALSLRPGQRETAEVTAISGSRRQQQRACISLASCCSSPGVQGCTCDGGSWSSHSVSRVGRCA